MLRMLVVFWALMSTAALLTEILFHAARRRPDDTARHRRVPAGFSWNYTTYLNIVFLALFARPVLVVPQPGAPRHRRALRP